MHSRAHRSIRDRDESGHEMNTLHVGRGTTHGAMTVFPLWGTATGYGKYTVAGTGALDVSELETGAQVNTLMLGNPGDRPVFVPEGTLFEGGWQHRMACHSVMIGVHQRIPVEVVCVEQGRWAGAAKQHTHGRRATPYVRDALRRADSVQDEVWNRVAVHTQDVRVPTPQRRLSHSELAWVRHSAPRGNPTGSLVARLNRAKDEQRAWSTLRPLSGQTGVLIGIAGQPYCAEVFGSPMRLRVQMQALLEAAALDARQAEHVATPSRRAHRFIGRVEQLELTPAGPAGVGRRWCGSSSYADVAALQWQDMDVHQRMTNVRHPMLAV